jgi:hypothetical protein
MRLNLLTIAGAFLLFAGTIELVATASYGGFAGSAPFVGAIGSPGLWGFLFGVVLIVMGNRRKRFSKAKRGIL